MTRLPVEFGRELGDVHRIPPVVAGPVGDVLDQRGVRPVGRLRQQLVEQCADAVHDVDVVGGWLSPPRLTMVTAGSVWSRYRTKFDPMNPAPPVMRMVFMRWFSSGGVPSQRRRGSQ